MKVAFDEHVPKDVAEALKALGGEKKLLRVEICSARDYAVPRQKGDVPWLEAFAADGGHVVVSGDAKMRGKLHEQWALAEAGFVVFFLAREWNQMGGHAKCAMLIRWWPVILETLESAKRGQFFEIPCTWNPAAMKEKTPPARSPKRSPSGRR